MWRSFLAHRGRRTAPRKNNIAGSGTHTRPRIAASRLHRRRLNIATWIWLEEAVWLDNEIMISNLFTDDLTSVTPADLEQAVVQLAHSGIEKKFRLDFKETWEPPFGALLVPFWDPKKAA